MERVLSVDERIRRAEEIYYRRRNEPQSKRITKMESSNKREKNLIKKLILQMLICITIYSIFYLIKNTNYIFSEEVLRRTNEILSYDINIPSIYFKVKEHVNLVFEDLHIETINNETQEITDDEETKQDEEITTQNDLAEENIGGEEAQSPVEETSMLTQMEQDAKSALDSNSFIVPLKGTITSRYGPRESNNPIVSKNHTGIDIAVNEGTVFIASMSGTVKEVSREGALGNHVIIENGNIETIYAHCKTIYVQEGQIVSQGDNIGEVGSTGNATGPHLHFEIKKEGRYIDPDLILDFE